MFDGPLVGDDEPAYRIVVLVQDLQHIFVLRYFGEGREAPEVDEDDCHLLPMERQRVLHASAHDHLRESGGEKALEPRKAFELRHLVPDALLERAIPFGQFDGQPSDGVVQALDSEHRFYSGHEGRLVDRLRQILVAPCLQARDNIRRIRLRRNHDDGDERKRRIGFEPSAHLDTVHPWHHHVE